MLSLLQSVRATEMMGSGGMFGGRDFEQLYEAVGYNIQIQKITDATEQLREKYWIPDAATSAIGLFVTLAMNPTMEKMTKPANMLVHEFMQHTMMESLK